MPPRLRYKARLKGLVAEHSLLHSRKRIGFTTFTDAEMKAFAPVIRPLVRTIPESGRESLYIALEFDDTRWPRDMQRATTSGRPRLGERVPRKSRARTADLILYPQIG